MNIKQMAANIRRTNTQTDSIATGITGIEQKTRKTSLESDFLGKTMLAREYGVDLKNQGQLNQNSLMGQLMQFRGEANQKNLTALDADIDRKQADAIFAQNRAQLAKQGIFSSDNIMFRLGVKALGEAGIDPMSMLGKGIGNSTDFLLNYLKRK